MKKFIWIPLSLILLGVPLILIGTLGSCTQSRVPVTTVNVLESRWEYKVVDLEAKTHDKSGDAAIATNDIEVFDDTLDGYGKDGWELVTNYLEMETAYPNLSDNPKYVTGLQPNVRPKRAVLIFKRLVVTP